MSSLQIFIDWFKEYYFHEFQDLSNNFKNSWIEYIINNNGDYISKDFVENHQDFCSMCGLCCKNQFEDCMFFDKKTNLCLTHDKQPWDICSQYPYGALDMVGPLTINCKYMVRLFLCFFNIFFTEKQNQYEKMDAYIIDYINSSHILTIYGTAKINKNGYFAITSRKEGFHGQLLHRLIWSDHYGEIKSDLEIHHIDLNKRNNNLNNLQLLSKTDHSIVHRQSDSVIHNLNKDEVIEVYQKTGSIKNVADFFGVSSVTMSIFFKENNIPHDLNYKRDILNFDQVLEYYNTTESLEKTAKQFNCSRETIRVLLKEHGIELNIGNKKSFTEFNEIRKYKNKKTQKYTYIYYKDGYIHNSHRQKTSTDIQKLIKWAIDNSMPLTKRCVHE